MKFEPYYKAVLLDCGRGFFSVEMVRTIIKEMADCGYEYLMLGFGNDGLRFLLDDMSIAADGILYDSEFIREAIIRENDCLAPEARGQWTEADMDNIVCFALQEGIEIIPMIDNPGHASSITRAMIACGLTNALLPSRNGSVDTGSLSYNISSPEVVSWARAMLRKYIAYFAGKGCRNFNLAMDEYAGCAAGWDSLLAEEKNAMIAYTAMVCEDVMAAGMNPIAFSDVIGHTDQLPEELIGINWNGTYLKNHRNLNANCNWYYVLGAEGDPTWCGYEKAMRCTKSIPVNVPVTEAEWQRIQGSPLNVPDSGSTETSDVASVQEATGMVSVQEATGMASGEETSGMESSREASGTASAQEASGAGCVFAVWNDFYLPSEKYITQILDIMKKLSESNPEYFRK